MAQQAESAGARAVDVWGTGAPFSAALAAALRDHGMDATCVDTVGDRLGTASRPMVFPVFDGRAGDDARVRRERVLRDAGRLATALAEGQIPRLILLGSTGAYGLARPDGLPTAESSPLAAVEGGTTAADARAVEALLAVDGVTVLRHAELLGPGAQMGLLARQLAGARLLMVRGTSPQWQVCHVRDLAAAVTLVLSGSMESPLDGPAVVASRGTLDQAGLEAASGRKRLELPLVVAEATAARLHRTRLAPGASDELPYLAAPVVVEPMRLPDRGFVPTYDAAGAVRAHLAAVSPEGGGEDEPALGRALAGATATVAAVGSAALLRRARRSRGR